MWMFLQPNCASAERPRSAECNVASIRHASARTVTVTGVGSRLTGPNSESGQPGKQAVMAQKEKTRSIPLN